MITSRKSSPNKPNAIAMVIQANYAVFFPSYFNVLVMIRWYDIIWVKPLFSLQMMV